MIIVTGITLDPRRKHMLGAVSVTKNPGLGNSWPPGTDLPPLFCQMGLALKQPSKFLSLYPSMVSAVLTPFQRSLFVLRTVVSTKTHTCSKCREVSAECSATNVTPVSHLFLKTKGPSRKTGTRKIVTSKDQKHHSQVVSSGHNTTPAHMNS